MTYSDVLQACGLLLRIFLAIVLVWAGVAKSRHLSLFKETVSSFAVLPEQLSPPTAVVIPLLEVSVGILLIAGVFTRAAAGISSAMLVAFSAAVTVNLRRTKRPSCFCFGRETGKIGWWTLYRNIGLFLMSVTVLIVPEHYASIGVAIFSDQRLIFPSSSVVLYASLIILLFVSLWVSVGEFVQWLRHLQGV